MTTQIKSVESDKIRLDKSEFYELFSRVENVPGQSLLLAIETDRANLKLEIVFSESVVKAILDGFVFSPVKKANKFRMGLAFHSDDLNEWYTTRQLETLFKIVWRNSSGWFINPDKKLLLN